MNTQHLKTRQKMFAVILGLAVIASAGGSLAYAQEYTAESSSGSAQGPTPIQGSINLPQLILSSVKVSFTTAASTAATAQGISNGQVLSGGLSVIQGSVVYVFKVTDGTNVYSVIVDAGNGNVLHVSTGHPLTMASILGGSGSGMRMAGHMGGMHAGGWSKPQTQNGASSNTSPSSGSTD